jgi:hypothetical protein
MRENLARQNSGGFHDDDEPGAESDIAAEADRFREENEEEEGEGETFERLLCEGMMRLCVDQCSTPKLKVSDIGALVGGRSH